MASIPKSLFAILIICIALVQYSTAAHSHNKHALHHRARSPRLSGAHVEAPITDDSLHHTDLLAHEKPVISGRQNAGSIGQVGGGSNTASSADYTCGPGKPCGNGACCGASGWCGYSPKFCDTGCQSNCDAKAECGQYAKQAGQGCPLNVCCSEHGFCGTTKDFCGDGCQSHCEQPKAKGGTSDPRQIVIGYYEGWSLNKKCGSMAPEEIPVHSLTHLIFSFGFIAPGTFKIENMPDFQPSLFGRVTDMKQKKPSLKVLIALGGWTHNDPGKYQKVFSDMASTPANRKLFISNLIGFMSQYGFDGVDLDWEYPGAEDRGGIPEDGANLTKLLKEMKQAMGRRYIVTFTAPTSYWYLRHFDIKSSADAADWINLMSYDLHGIWDRDNPIGNQILGHTNLTEIDLALDLFWRNDISPSKIVLGTGFYGLSFRLDSQQCWKPGCAFSGPGEKGSCTDTEGFLSYKEVKDILSATKAKSTLDKKAGVKYLTYGRDSWISYDDADTMGMKVDFAKERGLKGLMAWAIDTDDEKGDLIRALTGDKLKDEDDILQFMTDNGASIAHGTSDGTKCKISSCGTKDTNPTCEDGYTPVGRCNTDSNGKNRCNTGKSKEARMICCPSFSGPQEDDCRWHDERSTASKHDCSAKCDIGEINIINDSYGWVGNITGGGYSDKCGRGWKSFCCKAGNMQRYLDICTWTKCNEKCPSDKPHELTTDTGGPVANPRCEWKGSGDPFSGEGSGIRRLCCPRKNSFGNCNWESSNVCSSTCDLNKITLDLDPRGPDPRSSSCHNGRQQAFCCEPPGGYDRGFAPFNLENLFPEAHLPPADAIPRYDLVSFGGAYAGLKAEDPNLSGVAFFLIAGHSDAVTSMTKRDNPGLEFIECPRDILERPEHELQIARIVCMQPNVTDCFKVQSNGVEGTIVHMPIDCGGPSWSRAVALTPSANQTVPSHLAADGPTSIVYDFKFDYLIGLVRRDAGKLSIRMDYSNVPGYWNAVVDTPGSRKRDLNALVERFFGTSQAWYAKFNGLKFNSARALKISEKLDQLVYHNGQTCHYEDLPAQDGDLGESISIAMQGTANIELHYGFSLIATWVPGSEVKIHQAAGFVRPEGTTDVSFRLGGEGVLETSRSLKGSAMESVSGVQGLAGHNIFKGWAYFTAYRETGLKLESGGGNTGAVPFSGYAEARIKSHWGKYNVHFPAGATITPSYGEEEGARKEDEVSKSSNDKLNPLEKTQTGFIEVGATIRVGLATGMAFSQPYQFAVSGDLPDMSVSQYVYAKWFIEHKGDESCLKTSLGSTMRSHLAKGSYAGWDMTDSEKTYVTDLSAAGDAECYTNNGESLRARRRANAQTAARHDASLGNVTSMEAEGPVRRDDPEDQPDLPDWRDIPLPGHNLGDTGFDGMIPRLRCDGCASCTLENPLAEPCCGCACLDCKYGIYVDDGDPLLGYAGLNRISQFDLARKRSAVLHESHHSPNGTKERTHDRFVGPLLATRGAKKPSKSWKKASICNWVSDSIFYPGYPDWRNKVDPPQYDFNTHEKADGVMRYYHNTSSSCTSWRVAKRPYPDQLYDTRRNEATGQRWGWGQQFYQTEHPFEAQTISRFFNEHVQKRMQRPRNCAWMRRYILVGRLNHGGVTQAVIMHMMNELGTRDRRDRLAVFLASPNGMKGQISRFVSTVNQRKFDGKEAGDEQLLYAKNFGMIFSYWNINEIWNSWCLSYNGILDVLQDFDRDWALNNPHDPLSLATEWQVFILFELDAIVTNSRRQAMTMYNSKKPVGGTWGRWWDIKWWMVYKAPLVNQYSYISLSKTCRRLQ